MAKRSFRAHREGIQFALDQLLTDAATDAADASPLEVTLPEYGVGEQLALERLVPCCTVRPADWSGTRCRRISGRV